MSDEKIVTRGDFVPRKGLIAFLIIMAIAAFIIVVSLFEYLGLLIKLLVIISIPLFIWLAYLCNCSKYQEIVVTDKRVYVSNTKKHEITNEIPLDMISSMNKIGEEGFLLSSSSGKIQFYCVNRDEICDCISQLMKSRLTNTAPDELKKQANQMVTPKADEKSAEVDISVELKKYKALFENGLITQEEYEQKKKQLLDL